MLCVGLTLPSGQAVVWPKGNYWQQQLSTLTASKTAIRKALEKYAELVANPEHTPANALESFSSLIGVLTPDVVKMELVPQLLSKCLLAAHSDENWQPWSTLLHKLCSSHPKLPAALLVAAVAQLTQPDANKIDSTHYVTGATRISVERLTWLLQCHVD